MSHQDLEKALEIVQRELARADHLDAEEVRKLKATMEEIQSVLGSRTSEEEESLSERVASSARRFEESHPILTENLGRIADILQQMGF